MEEKNEEVYRLTPKGIASIAMLQTGLITSFDDPRFEGFWNIFVSKMIRGGFAEGNPEDHDAEG